MTSSGSGGSTSGIVLGDNRYGKAETRVVRVTKHPDRHDITDLTVSVALRGDFATAYLSGDNANVLPTDTMRGTIYAFAKEEPIGEIEDFGLRLARHFVADVGPVDRAEVAIEQHDWTRLPGDGTPHPHAFAHAASSRRTATVTCATDQAWVVSGIAGLTVLKTTDSEFRGFLTDRYTTLAEAADRILATVVTARWRHADASPGQDWAGSHAAARRSMLETFATHHSRAVQQTLYAMGRAVLADQPGIAEIRLALPNKHHLAVDLTPYGLTNDNEVFYAADRPYGLIEGTVTRDDAPPPGLAWG